MAFIVGAAIIGGVTSLVGTAISARAANKQRKSAEAAGARADAKIKTLEDSRKPIINPYSNVKDISSMAALQSKKGVAASIESQEAQNEKLKAQGEQQMQQAKMAEAQRLQQVQLSEAGRLQEADIQGQKFVFGQQEARTQQGLDRVAGLATQAAVDKNQALSNQAATIAGGVSAVGNIGSAYIKAKG